MQKPTVEDLVKYQDKNECGLYEAKAQVYRAYVVGEMTEIRNANEPANAKIVRLIDLLLFAMEMGT